MVLVSILRRN